MEAAMQAVALLAALGASGWLGWWVGARRERATLSEALLNALQLHQGAVETAALLKETSDRECSDKERQLVALREELERRKESHEVVVGALIRERDTWHALYKKTEDEFADTMAWYEGKLQEFAVLSKRDFLKQTEAERVARRARWNEVARLAPVRTYDVVKNEAGVSILVDKARSCAEPQA